MSLFSRIFLLNTLSLLATLGVVFFIVRNKAAGYFMALADKYGIEPAELHEMFLQALNYGFLIAGLICISIACIAIWWLARQFINPIEALSQQFEEISSGSLNVRAAPQSTSELAQLAGSFNAMANKLEQQENLRRRLVTDVAHELRTPLTNLSGTLEGIGDGLIKIDRNTLCSLSQEVERLAQLVNETLTLARLEAKQEPTEIAMVDLKNVLLSSARNFTTRFSHKKLRVFLKGWPQTILIACDKEKIYRVFENLFSNVSRFAPNGDSIICEFQRNPSNFTVKISNTAANLMTHDIDNIFERFYRGDLSRSTEGSGLGLSIVKELIELHGGTVGAKYRDNKFHIWFQLPIESPA